MNIFITKILLDITDLGPLQSYVQVLDIIYIYTHERVETCKCLYFYCECKTNPHDPDNYPLRVLSPSRRRKKDIVFVLKF